MSLFAVAVAVLTASNERVLVTSYQSLGIDAPLAAEIAADFRRACERPGLQPSPAEDAEKNSRAAVMCGEDAACLATVGQRAGARWVLAHGAGKVGSALLVTALFIDVVTGKEIARGSRRVADAAPDWVQVTRGLADEVVKPTVEMAPKIVEVPVRIEVPVEAPPHRLRTWGFISTGVSVAFAVVTGVLGLAAANNYQSLMASDAAHFDELVKNQRALNGSADTCLGATLLSAGAALMFFLIDWKTSS
jgi:hypothetical protein